MELLVANNLDESFNEKHFHFSHTAKFSMVQ